MPFTILMLGTRRRNHFIQQLRSAARERQLEVTLLGADVDGLDPFSRECDRFALVPHCSDPAYAVRLRELIVQNSVDLLMAWNDSEILRLSMLDAAETLPCRLALPKPGSVFMMCDKWATYEWLQSAGIATPRTEVGQPAAATFCGIPLVVKPRFGQGGVGVHVCRSPATFAAATEALAGEDYLVQDFVGGEEYTVDVVSHRGECVAAVPRRRLKVRGGEVMIARVEMHAELLELAHQLCKVLNQSLVFNFQAIVMLGRWFVIELNPRFGGGADLSIAAGMDLPGAYLDLYLLGVTPKPPIAIRDGLHMSRRFVSDFFFPEG